MDYHSGRHMKFSIQLVFLSLLLFLNEAAFGQTNQYGGLLIPYLDPDSQSNVIVTVCDLDGKPCPPALTNTLANPNLFTPAQQALIREMFTKYKAVTTNAGPSGTVLAGFYKTNNIIIALGRSVNDVRFVSHFQYTNSDASEDITFGHGMLAQYRTHSGGQDGYFVSFNHTSDGTLLSFGDIRHNQPDGILARFDDNHPVHTAWNFRLAEFSGGGLAEYIQYTNGLVWGKYLVWNPLSGKLIVQADFQTPYDYAQHRIDLPRVQIR